MDNKQWHMSPEDTGFVSVPGQCEIQSPREENPSWVQCIGTSAQSTIGTAAPSFQSATSFSKLNLKLYKCENCQDCFTQNSDYVYHKHVCNKSNVSVEKNVNDQENVVKVESINFSDVAKCIQIGNVPLSGTEVEVPQTQSQALGCKAPQLKVDFIPLPPSTVTKDDESQSSDSTDADGSFRCRYCHKEFEANCIQNHELIHLLGSPDKPYFCQYCGRPFANDEACKNHEKVHTEPKPFTCSTCGKGLMTAGSLKTHMLTHTGEKKFQCRICDKYFSTAGNMKNHEIVHTGERAFNCSHCGKKFTTAGNLKTHEKIHIGLKPFACEICNKQFTTAGNLKTHMLIHSGEKPFECDQCSKAFSTAGNLKTHYRLHTGEKPFNCYICDKSYPSLANLNAHHKCNHTGEKAERGGTSGFNQNTSMDSQLENSRESLSDAGQLQSFKLSPESFHAEWNSNKTIQAAGTGLQSDKDIALNSTKVDVEIPEHLSIVHPHNRTTKSSNMGKVFASNSGAIALPSVKERNSVKVDHCSSDEIKRQKLSH